MNSNTNGMNKKGGYKKVFMRKRNSNNKRWNNNYKRLPTLEPEVNQKINLELDTNNFCPYKTWRHYFPFEDYNAQSATANTINVFLNYMVHYFSTNDLDEISQRGCIHLDCNELILYLQNYNYLPNFVEVLRDSPENIIGCIGLSANHYIKQFYKNKAANSHLSENTLYKALADVPIIRARLYNFDTVTPLKNLKARQVGKFVTVSGTLVKVSNVKPVCTTMAFRCIQCTKVQALLLIDCRYMTPEKCTNKSCRCTKFEPLREHPLTEITDWQTIKLQEKLSEDQREAGRMPRTIEIELSRDLTDTASPGDVVTITGIVKVVNAEEGKMIKKSKNSSMYLLYIEGNHVVNARASSNSTRGDRRNASEANLNFTASEIEGIKDIESQPNLFSLLTCSLCPTIYGHNMVKAGILLCLFGGGHKDKQDTNRVEVRSNSHVLVVGDPGLGKSQLLQAVSRLAPRGVYVCGNTSSNSGLTVTLTRDSGSGDTGLEAGALVLADQGICCIDEFDKMSQQHQALLEAMEQQSISIAKGGVVCSMPARCSVVAAANPVKGHYNKAKTVSENLKMSGPLLSRFDLVYILLDTPNQIKDKLLSDHVMSLHTGRKKNNLEKDLVAITTGAGLSQNTIDKMGSLELRLNQYSSQANYDPLPHQLMWKYIAYARKNVNNVKISKEACQVLKEFYLELRKKGRSSNSTPITTRQLESMKRLTQARCRCELRSLATADDALEVVEIMKYSLYATYADENDCLQFNRNLHGSGVSRNKMVKNLLAILNQESQYKSKSLFNLTEIKELAKRALIPSHEVSGIVETLNDRGFILKSGPQLYNLRN